MSNLTFSGVESFENPSKITLEDKLLGSTVDVTNSLTYNFSYLTTDNDDRFILHFSNATGINDSEVQNIQVWAANHQLGKNIISVHGLNGTFIVRITTVKGVVTKKIVLL